MFLAEVQAWMASGAGPKVETKMAKKGRADGKGKAAKAIGEVPPTASTKDVPVKVEVAMPSAGDGGHRADGGAGEGEGASRDAEGQCR